jgi:hypothetical protein
MDLWAYLAAEQAKRGRALEIVELLIPTPIPPHQEHLWIELHGLLSTAPLAKKKE